MNPELINNLVKNALIEDIGSGDITSELTIPKEQKSKFRIIAKEDFILCGKEFVLQSFEQVGEIDVSFNFKDGDEVKKSDIIIEGQGVTRNILLAERVALNFLQYLCAISTLTKQYVLLAKPHGCEILDTRKTLPLYREAAKYAVLVGGGKNHRIRLDDQILIKDNHIAASGGVKKAIDKCKGKNLKIEVECETLEQVSEALNSSPDIIMLDNMDMNSIKNSLDLIKGKSLVEVSGNISLANVEEIAKLGADCISVGKITHSVRAVDISLEVL